MGRGRKKSELDDPHREQIANMIEDGKTPEEIQTFMSETYGLKISKWDISGIKKALSKGSFSPDEPQGRATRRGRGRKRKQPVSSQPSRHLAASFVAIPVSNPEMDAVAENISSSIQALRESYHRSFLKIRAAVEEECAAHGIVLSRLRPGK